MSINEDAAFVLHGRAYRDSSLLVEAFTQTHGRVSLVAKGARNPKSKWRGILQPFIPLTIRWQGRSSLKNLSAAETIGSSYIFEGKWLASSFYINELLLRLLQPFDSHTELFAYYQQALKQLGAAQWPDAVLRPFELFLLQQLGYGFPMDHESPGGDPIQAAGTYYFDPSHGLKRVKSDSRNSQNQFIYAGEDILGMLSNQWEEARVRSAAKRLMRQALAPQLGDKPLASRSLLQAKNWFAE